MTCHGQGNLQSPAIFWLEAIHPSDLVSVDGEDEVQEPPVAEVAGERRRSPSSARQALCRVAE
jgi:hypothetical protein